jgi:RloB-like protein
MKMQDKKEKDAKSKEAHIALLKAAQTRKRGAPDYDRDVEENAPIKPEKKSFLIISEGKNTEKSYFEQFKLPNAEIKAIGVGDNTFSLMEKAIRIRDEENEKRIRDNKEPFDFAWCVFDADPKPDNPQQLTNFINAIHFAKQNDMKVAYSNQAFEYWLILHFEDHQGGGMPRTDYHDKINGYLKPLGCYYDGKGSKIIDSSFFDRMLSIVRTTKEGKKILRQDDAISRAKRVLKFHTENGTSPEKAESSTTVFELVEALMKYK